MIRALILPIFRSTRLCVTVCGITHHDVAGHRLATSWVRYTTYCNTHSSALEDGQNNCPNHVELTGVINKLLLLHLVGCLYYLYQWCTVKQISGNEIYFLIKYVKSVLWRVAKCLSYIEDARCLKVKIHGVICSTVQYRRAWDMTLILSVLIYRVWILLHVKEQESWFSCTCCWGQFSTE